MLLLQFSCEDPTSLIDLVALISDHQCTVTKAQYDTQPACRFGSLLISGAWNHLAKLESAIHQLPTAENTLYHLQRLPSAADPPAQDMAPYWFSLNGILASSSLLILLQLFAELGIHIYSMAVSEQKFTTCSRPFTNIQFKALLPCDQSLADLRENFIVFCDEHNLDGIMEPGRAPFEL